MSNSYSKHSRDLRAKTATAHNKALLAAGCVRVTAILPPATAKELDTLTCFYGTRKAALIAAIFSAAKQIEFINDMTGGKPREAL